MKDQEDNYEYKWEHDGWWIDYMEGELAAPVKQALELLLSHSPTDRLILKNYQSLREVVKFSETWGERTPSVNMDALHRRIMERLDQAPVFEESCEVIERAEAYRK